MVSCTGPLPVSSFSLPFSLFPFVFLGPFVSFLFSGFSPHPAHDDGHPFCLLSHLGLRPVHGLPRQAPICTYLDTAYLAARPRLGVSVTSCQIGPISFSRRHVEQDGPERCRKTRPGAFATAMGHVDVCSGWERAKKKKGGEGGKKGKEGASQNLYIFLCVIDERINDFMKLPVAAPRIWVGQSVKPSRNLLAVQESDTADLADAPTPRFPSPMGQQDA